MKEITFIRHAKSSWKYDVSDRERPLKKRGIQDVRLVSDKFCDKNFYPQRVFSSPAIRARKTCELFVRKIDFPFKNVIIEEQIYDFGGSQVVNFIKSLDNNFDKIMIFGHNHAFTSIVNTYGDYYIDNLPTSGLVVIQFNIEKWSDLERGKTVLTIFPRDLK